MKPTPPSASGGHSEQNERSEKTEPAARPAHHSEARTAKHYVPHSNAEQEQLDRLLDAGFAWEEAVTLLNLREHLYENTEMRQRMTDDPRLNFVRWLYLNGEMGEGE